MQQLAKLVASNGDLLGYTYGETSNVANTWDATMVQGCHCDSYVYNGPYAGNVVDFQGHNCGVMSCPFGDDPEKATPGVTEKQDMTCVGNGGGAKLTFRQHTVRIDPATETISTLTTKLESLPSITDVTITKDDATTHICSVEGSTVTIEFRSEFGDVPLITAATTGTPAITFTETRKGTKDNLECSSRGTCDRFTGRCSCFRYFGSSDGFGNVGTRGDCGFKTDYYMGEL
jgi:hypothetical protein